MALDLVLGELHEAVAEVEAIGLAAGQDLEADRQAERVGFGEQDLQDRRAKARVVKAAVEIERIELDLLGADPEADAADDLLADQDQAQAGFVEMLAEDPPGARRLVAKDALEMLAHHVDAQRQQRFEVGLADRVEAPGRDHAAILATLGLAVASQSLVSSSIDRSSRPALKNSVSLARRSWSTTTLGAGLNANGGTAPMAQPVSSCAVSGLAKPHLRASNSAATAAKSSLRLPGRMASTLRRPPPPPRMSSTIALAAWSGRLPRITLILSERPSASCSITRNCALASVSNATGRSNTSPATDDLLRQKLQRLVECRHLA